MAVKIVNRKYNNQFYPLAQQTDWIIGNSGDWERLELEIEVSVDFFGTSTDSVTIDEVNDTYTLNNGKKWSDYGFDIGDAVILTYTTIDDRDNNDGVFITTPRTRPFIIQNMYGSTIESDTAIVFNGITMIPTDRGNFKIVDVKFATDKEPEGLHFTYGHVTNLNLQSNNLASFIDGSESMFSFSGLKGLTTLGSSIPMLPTGIQSGMAIESTDVAKLQVGNTSIPWKYKIGVNFMIASILEDVLDTGSILYDKGSLTDNFKIKMFPEWNNPNTIIQNNLTHTQRLGNTGGFGENFNGLDNDFKIELLKYTDNAGNVIGQLDYTKPTNVEIIVSGIANLSNSSEFGFGFAWIPQNESDFHNKTTPFHKNLFINTGRKYTDGLNDSFNLNEVTGATIFDGNTANSSKMDVQPTDSSVFFDSTGTTKARLKAKFSPNANFSGEFGAKSDDDRNYKIWISVANHDLLINYSNRVSLEIDNNEMVREMASSGPYAPMTTKFIEHPELETEDGVLKYAGNVEDDVLTKTKFVIDKTKNVLFDAMTFGYEVVNIATGSLYTLERKMVNLSVFSPDVFGVQQFNVNDVRGFKMEVGNNKNWVKIQRNSGCDGGNNSSYLAYFATRFRWEDWIPSNGVPSEYFDITKDNNGKHNDWIDYVNAGVASTHQVRFFILTDVNENGLPVRYKNTYDVKFEDYDTNPNINVDHKYFKDSDNTPLNIGVDATTGRPLAALLNLEPTRIEIEFENTAGNLTMANHYCEITIQIDKGPGRMQTHPLSSVWGSYVGNILKPLTGETKLKLTQTASNKIKASCLVDNTLLVGAKKWRISGKIGCIKTP
jgi:hypothetical protein